MRIKKHTLHFYTLKCYDGNANKGGVKYEIIYLLLVNVCAYEALTARIVLMAPQLQRPAALTTLNAALPSAYLTLCDMIKGFCSSKIRIYFPLSIHNVWTFRHCIRVLIIHATVASC